VDNKWQFKFTKDTNRHHPNTFLGMFKPQEFPWTLEKYFSFP